MNPWCVRLMLVAALLPGLPSAANPAESPLLKPIVERFWAAEVRADYDAVYAMLSPEERRSIMQKDYVAVRTDLGPFRYLKAQVGDVEVAGKLAWVQVKFDWISPQYPSNGMPGSTWHLWQHQDEGWFPIPNADRDRWPLLPPRLRPAADEAALAARVAGLWKAKAAQDWKGVYDFMPPYWREQTPLDRFLQSKARFLYLSPTVEWVEIKPSGEARARIAFEYKLNDPAVSKMKPQPEKLIEPWAKVDGVWYVDLSVLEQPTAPPTPQAQ